MNYVVDFSNLLQAYRGPWVFSAIDPANNYGVNGALATADEVAAWAHALRLVAKDVAAPTQLLRMGSR